MISEFLQDRAALYVAGVLTSAERDAFELLLEFQPELRAQVAALTAVTAAWAMSRLGPYSSPPGALKDKVLGAVDDLPQPRSRDALVVADTSGRVEWINPAFTDLCGYALEELRGRKPGSVLQGAETDPAPLQRIRVSLQERRPCRETLVNYHKDGTRYRVEVAITPILDDEGQVLWFVAQERKLTEEPSGAVG